MVDFEQVQSILKGLMAELDAVVGQREEIRKQEESFKNQGAELDRKIAGLKQSVQGLSLYSTAKNEPPELTKTDLGFRELMVAAQQIALPGPRVVPKTLTDCCRDILARSGEWLTALQVRQGLHAAGFNFSEYKSNPLSSIHTTLKRLVEGGQAWCHLSSNSETLYRWKNQGETVPPLIEIAAKNVATAVAKKKKPSHLI